VSDDPQILDFPHANLARVQERRDRIDDRLGELTTQLSAIERRGKSIAGRPKPGSTTSTVGSSGSNADGA
jgi:hypothetical protein